MTVSSLWKVLDTANCGRPVGADELGRTNDEHPRTLAVDLSIWICESLTAYGMNEQHSNPSLHLVFTRTMKLLNLGIGLVFVLEGKQRVTKSTEAILSKHDKGAQADTFRNRRSGTAFWKACRDCQELLELLGVPVVRAKCEGEALCALLNARGIVDGVISNDGDCLLFGAKVIYTKYSNENLDHGRVMRYDLDELFANVEPVEEGLFAYKSEATRVKLSRSDLIAFAVLTGSDLTGSGMEKVGYKKALRFLNKCKSDNPLSPDTACFDEMNAWAKAATANFPHCATEITSKCCSRCTHPGSKRGHGKDGCEKCGTGPGEQCYLVTTEDRFRLSLRTKALAMKFDPSQVFDNYLRPNDNQLPVQFMNRGVKMGTPQLKKLMEMSLIVKGHSHQTSQQYVRQSVLRLLSRMELHRVVEPGSTTQPSDRLNASISERPVAKGIVKSLTKNKMLSYEVAWEVRATVTDENGEGIDGYEYVTIEPQALIEQKYPQLLKAFQESEKVRAKQGDGMKTWRQGFLQSFVFPQPSNEQGIGLEGPRQHKSKADKKRKEFFSKHHSEMNHPMPKKAKVKKQRREGGDDIRNLLRFAGKPVQSSPMKHPKRIPDVPTTRNKQKENREPVEFRTAMKLTHEKTKEMLTPKTPETDLTEDDLYCSMGGFAIQITPIASNQGAYPPKHIFVHQTSE
jgi:flap endonuclease GEN